MAAGCGAGAVRKTPTEQQYSRLLTVGSGNMIVSGGDRQLRAMAKRGWVVADPPDSDNGFRITPDGLRALALAVQAYGLPQIGRAPKDRKPTPMERVQKQLREMRADRDREQARAHRAEVKLERIKEIAT